MKMEGRDRRRRGGRTTASSGRAKQVSMDDVGMYDATVNGPKSRTMPTSKQQSGSCLSRPLVVKWDERFFASSHRDPGSLCWFLKVSVSVAIL